MAFLNSKQWQHSMDRFNRKNAIVTGGAAGIGAKVVERLRSEGAEVMIWDLNTDDGLKVDITDPEAVEKAAEQTADKLGGIDILVCSAGITGPNTTVATYPAEAWRQVFDVNVHGLFYCNKAVIPYLEKSSAGRIVNIASVAGKEGNPNASAYSASKAAVIGLTKSLGKELANSSITVNCVTPAAVKTAIFDQMTEDHINFMLSKIPMGRFGQTDEIAALVAWLASDECSFTTGGVFDISGGRATY